MSSANRDSFTSFFAVLMHLISFPCLIALVRISSTVLNSSGRNGHSCLVSDLREESVHSFTIKSDITCGFSRMPFII